jgi:signal peptidase I
MEMDAYRDHTPGRGDIVVFEWNGETVIKRVAGGPGDTLWLLEYANDTSPLHARYVVSPSDLQRLYALYGRHPKVARFRQVHVPDDHVYVVGDAQNRSLDSRHFGAIALDRIIGRVLLPEVRSFPSIAYRP